MFSQRTDWDFEENPLSILAREKRASGEHYIDLTLSNPTLAGIPSDVPLLNFDPASPPYDPQSKGLLSARATVSGYYRKRGHDIDPESIFLTTGTSEAYSFLFRLLCNPGDQVLVPRPGYPLLEFLCRLNDVSTVPYHLRYDGEWHMDIQSVRDAITRRTKALILLHPHNPTGSYVKGSEKAFLETLALARDLPFIVDEVFYSFPIDSHPQRADLLALSDHLTFTLSGLSKLAAMPSMKLAWIVASGPVKIVKPALQRLEVIADTYLSVASPLQDAMPNVLPHVEQFTLPLQIRIRENYEFLRSALRNSAASMLPVEAGWNAIIRLPATQSDEIWCLRFLKDHNVLVHPGSLFDIGPETCIVASLLPKPEEVREAISRLQRSIAEN